MPRLASKGHALPLLASLVGCNREEVVGVGDANNDLTLLTESALAVAVVGAPQNLMDRAQLTIETPDNDGLASFLEHLSADPTGASLAHRFDSL